MEGVSDKAKLLMRLSEADREGLGEVAMVAGGLGEVAEGVGASLVELESQVSDLNTSFTATEGSVERISERVCTLSPPCPVCGLVHTFFSF